MNDSSTSRYDRRRIISWGAQGLCFGSLAPSLAFAKPEDQRYFIHVHVDAGLKSFYLFDCRDRGKYRERIEDYLGGQAKNTPWPVDPKSPETALAGPLTAPLKAYAKDFSVINGVYMTYGNDVDHPGNSRAAVTGAKGLSTLLATTLGKLSLVPGLLIPASDVLTGVPVNPGTISLANGGTATLQDVHRLQGLPPNSPMVKLLAENYRLLAKEGGELGQSAEELVKAIKAQATLNQLSFIPPRTFAQKMAMVINHFNAQLGNTALIQTGGSSFDMHGRGSAQNTRNLYRGLVREIVVLIKTLKDEKIRGSETSYLERTTFLITSDFNRTLSNNRGGTDHNPYGCSILVGGAGILGGRVVGKTDYRLDNGGALQQLRFRPGLGQRGRDIFCGKLFDYKKQQVLDDANPESLPIDAVIGIDAVANTVLQAVGSKDRIANPSGKPPRLLTSLLA